MQVDTSFIQSFLFILSEFSVCMYSDDKRLVGRSLWRWKNQRPWKQNMELLLLMVMKMMFQLHKLYTVVWDGIVNLQGRLTSVLKQVAEAVAYFNILSRQSPWRYAWSKDILLNSNIYILYQWQILIQKSDLAERCNAAFCTLSLDLVRIHHCINTHIYMCT